ncbi:MAG: flagellar export protein FliJ [Oscillospiraceae bacterium]
MKKFVFQLETLYKLKKNQKETYQNEYAVAESVFVKAYQIKERLEESIEAESLKYEATAKDGMTVCEMRILAVFLDDLQKRHELAAAEAEHARQTAERKHQALIHTYKEVKSLEKLREKQYEEYLIQEEKRANSGIEDLISFRACL